MRRIYFLVPNVDSAKGIVTELLLKHVEERHIHIVARSDISLEELPKAKLAQRTDLIPSIEKGIATGGVCGVLAGLAVVAFPPTGLALGGGALLGLTAFGAGFGAWASSMIGISIPNSHIEKYKKAISEGQLLLMIDVPAGRVDEVEKIIRQHHPEVELKGTDPTIPAFP